MFVGDRQVLKNFGDFGELEGGEGSREQGEVRGSVSVGSGKR